jgi:ribosome-associated protein
VKNINSAMVKKIISALEEKKGVDIQVLDVRDLVSYTDFLVLCTGTSSAHVSALVENARETLPKGDRPVYVNPSKNDSWWILDFVDVVVHVFQENERRFYDLEQLWGDAKKIGISE